MIAAEPITDVDTTAADMLAELDEELNAAGTFLVFAELKDPVRAKLERYEMIGPLDPLTSSRPSTRRLTRSESTPVSIGSQTCQQAGLGVRSREPFFGSLTSRTAVLDADGYRANQMSERGRARERLARSDRRLLLLL